MRRSDNDFLRQAVENNTAKLDQLLRDLPTTYQDRIGYEKRHEALERRVDALEERTQDIDDTIGNLHNESMKWANETFSSVVKEFTEEFKAIRREMSDLRIALYGLIIGSILLPLLFVIAAHYLWP